MLYFAIPRVFLFHCFFVIDLKNTVFDRILDFRQHVVSIPMNHLNRFFHFAAGICEFLLLFSFPALFVVVLCKCLRQHRNQRAVSGKINGLLIFTWLIRTLRGLFNRNFQSDQRFPRTWDTCNKANTLFFFLFAGLDDLPNTLDRPICRGPIRLMPDNVLYRVVFIQ